MKSFLTTFFSLFFIFNFAAAQKKMNLKDSSVKIEYTALPLKPLNSKFKFYSVSFTDPNATLANGNLMPEQLANSTLKLNGFTPLPTPDSSDFHISITIGKFELIDTQTKEQSEQKTRKVQKPGEDKKTRERYTEISYYNHLTYRLPMEYLIVDFEGNKIEEGNLVGANKTLHHTYGKLGAKKDTKLRDILPKSKSIKPKTYNGPTITSGDQTVYLVNDLKPKLSSLSPEDLNQKYTAEFGRIITNLVQKTISQKIKSFGNQVKNNYDFQRKKEKTFFHSLSKKSTSASTFNNALTQVRRAFAKMRFNQPVDEIKTSVKPSIETWQKLKEGFDADSKKGQRGKQACLHNIAATYFWLEEFDETNKYLNEAFQLKLAKTVHLENLKYLMEQTKKSMRLNKVTTRHFKRNFQVIKITPPIGSEKRTQPILDAAGNITFDGSMQDRKGNQIKGKFVISKNKKKELEFGKQGNIKFHWEKNNVPLVSHLSPKDVKSFKFNQRNFTSQSYQAAIENGTSNQKILECLFTSEKIKVFKYYPYEPSLNNNKIEISLQRKSDAKPVSTVGDEFLIFKRGLAAFFKDCEALQEVIKSGEFENNEVDMVRIAKFYNECK